MQHQYGFYYGSDGADPLADFDYAEDIGKPYGINYNKPMGCLDAAVTGSDFNVYYRHLGGNTRISKANEGDSVGEYYGGCYQTSEFADGVFKNGTYMPMYFTGTITGNAEEYFSFISENGTIDDSFTTGIYVYQWYKSGDSSRANDNITGFGALCLTEQLKSNIDTIGLYCLIVLQLIWITQSKNGQLDLEIFQH